ncbi:hypothetical protein [Streptomyces milbemycinicus]|uniref:hypothetical protein n=1 Tax=Streptomyces milbemycinicus TaxID=476552 RepID=UPI000A3AAFA3|nr:hypothetical protein [Streptomyces milbemycinicus]
MSAPHGRAGADLRILRAAVFTAVCVVLSAGGHMLASCTTVPLWTVGVGCAVLFAVVAPLAGRERSLPGIAALLGVGQLALHALFALGQSTTQQTSMTPGTGGSQGGVTAMAGRLLCGAGSVRMDAATAHRIVSRVGLDPATAAHQATSGPVVGAAHPGALLPSPPMVLGHLLAALAVGWLLRRGEMAVWRAVRLSADGARGVAEAALVRALRAALRLVRALRAGQHEPDPASVRRPRTPGQDDGRAGAKTFVLQHSVIRRGPPRFTLAA